MPWTLTIGSKVIRGDWQEDYYPHFTVYWLQVHNPSGKRYIHHHQFDDYNQAVRFKDRVGQVGDFTPENKPGIWEEGQPVYGSEEYILTGGDLLHYIDLEPELFVPEHLRHQVALGRDMGWL